jgi:hypothetical protein
LPGKYVVERLLPLEMIILSEINLRIGSAVLNNTDILYLKTQEGLGSDYIRHSQVAGGFPVFCAGEFHVGPDTGCGFKLDTINNITEINNFSGHYKPACRCLGVLADKMAALGINTQNMVTKFMGNVQDCAPE